VTRAAPPSSSLAMLMAEPLSAPISLAGRSGHLSIATWRPLERQPHYMGCLGVSDPYEQDQARPVGEVARRAPLTRGE
jgi:hypothetical protein